MRSMELVGRERMDVAVRLLLVNIHMHGINSNLADSNNYPSGEKVVTTMFPISLISLAS